MRKMSSEERKQIELEVTSIMRSAVSSEYARYILEDGSDDIGVTLMDEIVQDVMESSAWDDEGYYNEYDIRFAIGRCLMCRLGILD